MTALVLGGGQNPLEDHEDENEEWHESDELEDEFEDDGVFRNKRLRFGDKGVASVVSVKC